MVFGKLAGEPRLWALTKPAQAVDECANKDEQNLRFHAWQGLKKDRNRFSAMHAENQPFQSDIFVSRKDEFAVLEDIIDQTLTMKTNYAVHLSGVPGIGKTD